MSEPEVEESPKRLVTWRISRQRLTELVVVVFGVMIALGAENLVEEIRLRGDARDLEIALQGEVYGAVVQSWERQLVAPCLSQRLSTLAGRVSSATEGKWTPIPAPTSSLGGFDFATPQAYRSPNRLWTTSTFDRALGSEAFKRVPRARADIYVGIFNQIATMSAVNDAEYFAAASLAPLSYVSTEMTSEVRSDLLQQISSVDRHQELVFTMAGQIMDSALTLPDSGLQSRILKDEAELRGHGQKIAERYGACSDLRAIDRLLAKARSRSAPIP